MTLLLKIVPIAPLCLPTSVFVFKGDLVFCTIPENVAGKSSGLTQAPDKRQVRLTGNEATGSVPGFPPTGSHLSDDPRGRDAEPESRVWIRRLTTRWEKNYAVCQEFVKTENHAMNH